MFMINNIIIIMIMITIILGVIEAVVEHERKSGTSANNVLKTPSGREMRKINT